MNIMLWAYKEFSANIKPLLKVAKSVILYLLKESGLGPM